MNSLSQTIMQTPPIVLAGFIFIAIFVLNWMGYRSRKRMTLLHPQREVALGAAEGALLGLMALLLAFTFGMATTKFESRRQLIIEEANHINAAIMRSELYPDSIKQLLLPHFKQYVEARIAYYDLGDNPGHITDESTMTDANQHFKSIWSETIMLTRDKENRALADQMVPVLINMKNIVAAREAARRATLPLLITIVLLLLVLVSSFLMGFGVKPGHRNAVISMAFGLMTTATLFLVMELVRPRQGFINLENAQQNMVDLRKMF